MKIKRITALAAIMIVFLVNTSVCANNSNNVIGDNNIVIFADVPVDYWAGDQINYFARQGIVDGYEDGTFNPEGGVTREEFCKLLVATFHQTLPEYASPSFADVPVSKWSYLYVELCKEFLTGYANPFGGLPSFHPEEYATREDIAVALVRMMGFTDQNAKDKNYAVKKFTDGDRISPNLLPYVSIACERGLINGYPDGSFAPTLGITRAETVVLLNRATKQAVTNINNELEVSANVTYSKDAKTATVSIMAEEGCEISVNGEKVKTKNNSAGYTHASYTHTFSERGKKDFVIWASKSGKERTIIVTAQYNPQGPVITILNCPENSDKPEINIIGVVSDAQTEARNIILIVNGERVYVKHDGSWESRIELTSGENIIKISATNNLTETTTEVRTIKFDVDAPELIITECPKESSDDSVRIRGTVSDKMVNKDSWEDVNDVVTLTINNQTVYVNSLGSWSEYLSLEEGDNEFVIVASNKYGKSTTERVTIRYEIPGPELVITKCPEKSDESEITIEGTAGNDYYYYSYSSQKPIVKVNGERVLVNNYGEWFADISLEQGTNKITVTAEYQSGGKTTLTRTIDFDISKPKIEIYDCPSETTQNTIEITGNVTDKKSFASQIDFKINGKSVELDYDGEWSEVVTLAPGQNKIEFFAVNEYNVSEKIIRNINYVDEIPDSEIEDISANGDDNVTVLESERIAESESEGAEDVSSVEDSDIG